MNDGPLVVRPSTANWQPYTAVLLVYVANAEHGLPRATLTPLALTATISATCTNSGLAACASTRTKRAWHASGVRLGVADALTDLLTLRERLPERLPVSEPDAERLPAAVAEAERDAEREPVADAALDREPAPEPDADREPDGERLALGDTEREPARDLLTLRDCVGDGEAEPGVSATARMSALV